MEPLREPTNARIVHVTGGVDRLLWRLGRHLDAFAPRPGPRELAAIVDAALARAEVSFAASALPGYRTAEGTTQFDPVQSDQYAMFVWFCSNEAWRAGNLDLAADLFLLNKGLNGVVCMWDTGLPAVFLWIHIVGTMLGKADYGERFVAYQNVTVGTDRGERPSFGEGTILFAGAKVVGGAKIGARSLVSLNAVVIDETIPPNSIVAGSSPQLIVKARRRWLYGDYFRDEPAPGVTSILHARAGIPRFKRLLRTGEPATIVAFGTSLTLGNAYLDRLPGALGVAYPAARCTLINRGRNGYMTMAAAFRVAKDVLPHAPDLVLIEFAHNDVTEVLVEYIASALEGMLAQIRRAYPNCEFAFVNLALAGTAEAGPTAAMSVYEAVANAYGIPSFDLATHSETLVREGSAVWYGDAERALTVDGIHHAPAAAALLGEPFAAAFLQLLEAGGDGADILSPRASALLTVSRNRAADRLSDGVWAVRALDPTELRGAGIDEEGLAESRAPGATVRVAFAGTNAFAWVSGAGVFGVRILETNERFRVGVDAVAKWFWCSLMETHPSGRYTLEIVALDAGLLIGDICVSGILE